MNIKRFRSSITTKILLGFGTAIVILVTAGIIAYQSFYDLMRSLDFLSKPEVKLVKLNDLLSDLSLSENNIRSYFISNEKKYLDQYHLYSSSLEKNLDSLSYLTSGSEERNSQVARIADLWYEKKKHTQDLIELYGTKQDKRLPDGILRKLNEANPNVPTVIITKTITIRNVTVPEKGIKEKIDQKEETDEKRSFLGRLFKRKDKQEVEHQDSLVVHRPAVTIMKEVTTLIDTIYTVGQANEVKEEAFSRILTNIRNQNLKSRKELRENEAEIIQKDIGLIEYIRNIVLDLKNAEQEITEKNIKDAKTIVEVSIIKLFLFGVSGISAILFLGFMILHDVRKQNYHKNQLLTAKMQAEELVKVKENFLATMSHEIRTPLNSIVGFTEQLSQTSLQNKQKYYLQAISNSTTHLLSLVNDILDHSRIEAGKIDFEETTFVLKEVIEEVYDAFYIKAAEKHLLLNYSIKGDEALLTGDPLRLKQILFNLVSNAIKFTPAGSVSINCEQRSLTAEESEVTVSVSDTGIGIPPESIGYIFDTFSQADSSVSRKYGGTGLGLAISRKLVELQGGKIWVNSSEGKGSAFTFHIKYRRSSHGASIKTYHETPDLSLLKGMSILVVEDDDFNLLLFHTILTKWHVNTRIVSSAEEALQALNQETYDLIITDIHMPGMSGIDFFKEIKSHHEKRISGIPVVAVTANVIKESMKMFKDSGFVEILLKPFKEEELARAILKGSGKKNIFIPAATCTAGNPEVSRQELFSDFVKFSGGNMNAVHNMLDAFISNSAILLENLKAGFEERDWEKLKEAAHKLIPGFGHVQNYEMTEQLKELETYLHQARVPDAIKLEKMVREIWTKGKEQIRIIEAEKTKLSDL